MNKATTIQNIIDNFRRELAELYPPREIDAICHLILEHTLNYTKTDIYINKEREIDEAELKMIEKYISQLKKYRPIQYILGETLFYDLYFDVNEHTLIPRPETEELVHWIIHDPLPPTPNILDIGTGSGCIPITLALHIDKARVMSIDISPEALNTAHENAKRNKTEINLALRDIFKWEKYQWPSPFDLIVSNPPYVRESEKSMIENNVLCYEPETALFVTDEDPLIFYRTIGEFAKHHLRPQGKLFLEINEYLGMEMIQLLQKMGFSDVILRKDINGRDRMISATWQPLHKKA